MLEELWDVLDVTGKPTGKIIKRGDALAPGEYHVVVHIWLRDKERRYLIQRRADHLDWKPGIWSVTGGSVVHTEDSKAAAKREVFEELGIVVPELTFGFRLQGQDSFQDVWLAEIDPKLADESKLENAVAAIAWKTRPQIEAMVENGTFVNIGSDYFTRLFAF